MVARVQSESGAELLDQLSFAFRHGRHRSRQARDERADGVGKRADRFERPAPEGRRDESCGECVSRSNRVGLLDRSAGDLDRLVLRNQHTSLRRPGDDRLPDSESLLEEIVCVAGCGEEARVAAWSRLA